MQKKIRMICHYSFPAKTHIWHNRHLTRYLYDYDGGFKYKIETEICKLEFLTDSYFTATIFINILRGIS